MNIEDLSKEELIALLNKVTVREAPQRPKNVCKYQSIRSGMKCTIETEGDFCQKHENTVQAKRSKPRTRSPPPTRVEEATSPIPSPVREVRSARERTQEPSSTDSPPKEPLLTPTDFAPAKPKKRVIKPNKWHRYEDEETHIVFDPSSRRAYGVQDHKTGRVKALTEKYVNMCRVRGWKYQRKLLEIDPYDKILNEPESEESEREEEEHGRSEEAEDDSSSEEAQYHGSWASDVEEDSD